MWLLGIVAVAVAFAQEATPRQLIDSMEGRDLYRAYCASCHGWDAKGGGTVAPVLRVKPADLTTIARRRKGPFPAESIERIVLLGTGPAHGSGEMPVWGPVFRKVENDKDYGLLRVRLLVDYLRQIQQR